AALRKSRDELLDERRLARADRATNADTSSTDLWLLGNGSRVYDRHPITSACNVVSAAIHVPAHRSLIRRRQTHQMSADRREYLDRHHYAACPFSRARDCRETAEAPF